MSLNTLSVTRFNTIIRDILNAEELLHNVKIVGEVFGISSAKNAVYFSIKDEESTLPCICFYSDVFNGVKEGDSVVVHFLTNLQKREFLTRHIKNLFQQSSRELGLSLQKKVR